MSLSLHHYMFIKKQIGLSLNHLQLAPLSLFHHWLSLSLESILYLCDCLHFHNNKKKVVEVVTSVMDCGGSLRTTELPWVDTDLWDRSREICLAFRQHEYRWPVNRRFSQQERVCSDQCRWECQSKTRDLPIVSKVSLFRSGFLCSCPKVFSFFCFLDLGLTRRIQLWFYSFY